MKKLEHYYNVTVSLLMILGFLYFLFFTATGAEVLRLAIVILVFAGIFFITQKVKDN